MSLYNKKRLEENDKKIFNRGKSQGITQGIEQSITKIAKKMISMGMKDEDIKEATGLKMEEIKKLKEAK